METFCDAQFRSDLHWLLTEIVRILGIAIADELAARFPATALRTRESTHHCEILMMGIGFPSRRFSSSRDHHAGAQWCPTRSGFDGRSQVHGKGNRTDDTLCIVHQSHELPRRRLTNQIDNPIERGMVVIVFSTLKKSNFSTEMIDNFLVACGIPPFRGEVEFASGH